MAFVPGRPSGGGGDGVGFGDAAVGEGDGVAACATVSAEATLERVPVDVVWVVDDSGSMLDEQQRIQENIAAFASRITEQGVDVHVVIVTNKDLAQGTALDGAPSYLFVRASVGSHNALEVLLDQFDNYRAQLRTDAITQFVVVTDDESRLAGDQFRTEMEGLLGHGFTLHAIASENIGGRACDCDQGLLCGAAAPGDEYYALAAATGGQQVSICTTDWGAVFDKLVEAVVKGSPLPCSFDLPPPPDGETLDPTRVRFEYVGDNGPSEIPRLATGGDCGGLVAWRYDSDAAPKKIEMCDQACDALSAGGSVRIALGCEATVVK